MNQVHEMIVKRRSIVSFSDREVTNDQLNLLFEAARWAPSSRNIQPWRFLYTRKNSVEHKKLFDLLSTPNQRWAGEAPILALSIAESISTYKETPNYYAFHDLGMAMGNFLVQATSMGLFVHQMGGYDREKARYELNIPSRFDPAAMIALGYHDQGENLPDDLITREKAPRTRHELDQFVFEGKLPEQL